MENDFLNCFYSRRRIVSITELTNTRQWANELVIDYISHWNALSLKFKDHFSEYSAVWMCAQGID